MATQPLWKKLTDDTPTIYYTEAIMNMLEQHIPYLLQGNRTTTIQVEVQRAHQYEYDFYGLLLTFNIPRWMHWITMRLNGMTSPDEYRATMTSILIPDSTVLERLKSVESTVFKLPS